MNLRKLQVSLGDELKPESSFSPIGKTAKSDLVDNNTIIASIKILPVLHRLVNVISTYITRVLVNGINFS
jgi:hypothetical protein